jgi:hypothetical protein
MTDEVQEIQEQQTPEAEVETDELDGKPTAESNETEEAAAETEPAAEAEAEPEEPAEEEGEPSEESEES